jgi:hypothetical protein
LQRKRESSRRSWRGLLDLIPFLMEAQGKRNHQGGREREDELQFHSLCNSSSTSSPPSSSCPHQSQDKQFNCPSSSLPICTSSPLSNCTSSTSFSCLEVSRPQSFFPYPCFQCVSGLPPSSHLITPPFLLPSRLNRWQPQAKSPTSPSAPPAPPPPPPPAVIPTAVSEKIVVALFDHEVGTTPPPPPPPFPLMDPSDRH